MRKMLDDVDRAIKDIAEGRPVLVVDDENRENEGDIIFAAAMATPELLAFTIRYTSGVICMPMREAELDEMQQHWAAENERIMREHPSPATVPSLLDDGYETEPIDAAVVTPDESAPTPRALPPARPPEEAAAEAEPSVEPARRLRRGSEFDDGSVL